MEKSNTFNMRFSFIDNNEGKRMGLSESGAGARIWYRMRSDEGGGKGMEALRHEGRVKRCIVLCFVASLLRG